MSAPTASAALSLMHLSPAARRHCGLLSISSFPVHCSLSDRAERLFSKTQISCRSKVFACLRGRASRLQQSPENLGRTETLCRSNTSQLRQQKGDLPAVDGDAVRLLKDARISGVLPAVKVQVTSAAVGQSQLGAARALGGGFVPRLPRRLLVTKLAKGLLGLLVLGGGFFPGTPAAMARAKLSEAEEVLKNVEWPQQFPFKAEDFQRYDENVDTSFYSTPRFVTHIDDAAISALTKYYEANLPPAGSPGVAVLDMCSSWISHYPKGYQQERIVGMGLNEEELKRNSVLTEYLVQDLNVDPKLPFEDNSFDVITNVVSVDYLSRPLEIFREMQRILKPGGSAIMSFSNRCFWTKAISIWTSTGDIDHCWIVGSYFHYAGGFEPPKAVDISPNPGRTDPMYVVFSRKLQA